MDTPLRTKVRNWLDDYSVGLGMLAFFLVLGAVVTISIRYSMEPEGYSATITKLKSKEAHTRKETVCNGDPVLLICGKEQVEEPAWYRVELTYSDPATEVHRDRGKTCSVYVDQEEYLALELGTTVEVQYRTWDGCAVKAWPAKAS